MVSGQRTYTMAVNPVSSNKTTEFFYKLAVVVFLCGMPNFWIEDVNISKKITKLYRVFSQILAGIVNIFLVFEIAAFFTDQNLTEKQEVYLILYGLSHPMLWTFTIILSFQTTKIQKILSHIFEIKKVFNDPEVEQHMVKKSKLYLTAYISSVMLSMIMYTFDGFLQVLKGKTFTTIITAWPDVENNSIAANLVRVVWNVCWWVLVIRSTGVYAFVISLTTNMSHQFMDLQKYFYSLDNIFDEKPFNQREAEIKFEKAVKLGIDLYKSTTQCVNQIKVICGSVLSGQIIFNIIVLVISMAQMLSSTQNLMGKAAIALTALAVLIGTGLFMCNAGDITVEASQLATAMYSSGWQHCQGRTLSNVRQMLVLSMIIAQRPVVVYGLGIMELSYQSYVSLLKSTYSVFSLLYMN